MNKKNIKIYVVSHKRAELPTDNSMYVPLMVGNGYGELPGGCVSDRCGFSIAEKNLRYNELTGLYWVWKNRNDEIVGICHYRRFFTTYKGKMRNLLFHKADTFISQEYIAKILRNYDVILHNKTFFIKGNEEQLCAGKNIENLNQNKLGSEIFDLIEETIKIRYPEDIGIYRKIMERKYAHLLNIMIARKEVIDGYCEWLFPLLGEIEKKIDEKYPGKKLPRVMGLIAERLLDVWVVKKKLKVKECFSINTERIDWKMWG